jgi:hypothetical protein
VPSEIEPVSGRSLRKTGIIQWMARDFQHFRPATPQIGSLETTYRIAKARHWWAFLPLSPAGSRRATLPGWERSADRARLRANSLLTGNFAFLEFRGARLKAETAVPQRLCAQFPGQANSENILKSREFSSPNRECSHGLESGATCASFQLPSMKRLAPVSRAAHSRLLPSLPAPARGPNGALSMRDQVFSCERRSHSSRPMRPRRASPSGTSERSSTRPPQYRASGSRTTSRGSPTAFR